MLVVIDSVHLFRGGFYLLFEKESDAIEITGIVEILEDVDFYTGAKYSVEANHGRGQAIVIKDQKYYVTTYGDLEIGDRVLLKVLPKSRFVLSMEKQPLQE